MPGGQSIWRVALLALALLPAPAQARTLETILQDDAQLLHRPEAQLRRSLEELKLLGVDRIRVTAGWSVLTRHPDERERPAFDATDPAAYEQERFRNLDRLVVLAGEYGFKTMMDIAFFAPKWASADAPGERGRTHVDAAAFRDFAVAVARRYSGSFVIPFRGPGAWLAPVAGSDERWLAELYGSADPAGTLTLHDHFGTEHLFGERHGDDALDETLGTRHRAATRPLPEVDLFTLWNEPNHPGFLRPQWARRDGRSRPHSPHVYRRMVRLGVPAIRAARPDARVLIGGTAFDGGTPGSGMGGVPPLRFLRELACVNRRFRPITTGECRDFRRLPGDGWAHHPYSMLTRPGARNPAGRPDQVPIAELPRLARTLARLVKLGRIEPAVRELWVTEYGYETNPPVATSPWSPNDQAVFLPWAEYLAWRVPTVRSFAQFLLRDLPPGSVRVNKSELRGFGQWHSGLQFADGAPKWQVPDSFRAALVAERRLSGRLHLWVRMRVGPGAREVVVERAEPGSSAWHPVATRPPGGRRATISFSADGAAVTQRFAGRARRGHHYRLRYATPDGWRTTPRVRVIRRH